MLNRKTPHEALVMIDHAEANGAEPAEVPEEILIGAFIGEKIQYRFEGQTKRPGPDQMPKSLDAPGGSPECHWIARLHVEVQQFALRCSNRQQEAPASAWANQCASSLTLSAPCASKAPLCPAWRRAVLFPSRHETLFTRPLSLPGFDEVALIM